MNHTRTVWPIQDDNLYEVADSVRAQNEITNRVFIYFIDAECIGDSVADIFISNTVLFG